MWVLAKIHPRLVNGRKGQFESPCDEEEYLMFRVILEKLGKSVFFYSPLRPFLNWFPRWTSCFEPAQLVFIAEQIREVRDLEGCILEVGVSRGDTAIFMNRFMKNEGITKKYVGIDTFGGFTSVDVDVELSQRGKNKTDYKVPFAANNQKWVEHCLRDSGCSNTMTLHKADCAEFDYDKIGPISFALVDVDLWKPTSACLPKIYKNVVPGGVLVVDDCRPNNKYDGALQAYEEFCEANHLPISVHYNKLGFIRKPKKSD